MLQIRLFRRYIPKLKSLWISVLRDYSVLVTQNTATQKAYPAAFFTFSTISSVLEYYQQAWSVILLACSYLVNTQYWTELSSPEVAAASSSHIAHGPKEDYNLLFGLAMISLAGTIASSNTVLLRACHKLLSPENLKDNLSQVCAQDLCLHRRIYSRSCWMSCRCSWRQQKPMFN